MSIMQMLAMPFNAATGYRVTKAVWTDGVADQLNKTFSGADADRKRWTFSTWVKRHKLTTRQGILGAGGSNTNYLFIQFNADNSLEIQEGGTTTSQKKSAALFRDTTAWVNIVVTRDDTSIQAWANGVELTWTGTNTSPGSTDGAVGNAVEHVIGANSHAAISQYANMSFGDPILITGTSLDHTSFGEFNADTGNWEPIDPSGLAFGTNGFWLDFKDSAVLGKDVSQGIDDSTTYRYFKLDITAVDGSGTYTGAGEFALIADGVEYPTSAMTSNSAPSPLVASATGDTGQPPWKAFDGLTTSSNYWQYNSVSFPIYLKIDLGSGNGIAPQQLILAAPETPDRTPYDFTLQGSNDDSAWTTLETYTGVTSWTARESRTFGIQGNHFTEVSMTAAQQVSDVPTNDTDDGVYGNTSVMNPLALWAGTLASGNLLCNGTTQSSATLVPSSGKWYFEVDTSGSTNEAYISLVPADSVVMGAAITGTVVKTFYSFYSFDGKFYAENVASAVLGTWGGSSEVIQVAWDADTGEIWVGENNTWHNSGDPAAGTGEVATASAANMPLVPYVRANGTTICDMNFGQKGFTYTPPTGFLALNTANLPAPTIEDPSVHHFVDGSVSHNGTTGSFTLPGDPTVDDWLIIVKSRTATEKWWMFDAIRGYTKYISCDSTSGSTTDATTLSVASSGVVTMGAAFTSGTYVVEAHKAGATSGSGTSNSDGTITSTISVNTTSGFSIITYTGTGANATVGHGLTNLPECVWGKRTTDAESWMCHYVGMAGTGYFGLNATTAVASAAVVWNSTTPSSTVVSLGSNASINGSSKANVMYCWHSVEGYSKFGSYEGNGSTDGTYIHLGFSCGSWLTKTPDTTGNWYKYDTQSEPYNVKGSPVFINTTAAKQTFGSSYYVDFTSNGIKARTAGDINGARAYIYSAFADTVGTASSQTKAK